MDFIKMRENKQLYTKQMSPYIWVSVSLIPTRMAFLLDIMDELAEKQFGTFFPYMVTAARIVYVKNWKEKGMQEKGIRWKNGF